MNVFDKHQIKIARDTLKMSDTGARIMGGMTKVEARAVLKKHGIARPACDVEPNPDSAYVSEGLGENIDFCPSNND